MQDDSHNVKACIFLYLLAVLVLAWFIRVSAYEPVGDPLPIPSPVGGPPVAVIVQGVLGADLGALVGDQGGEVTRPLGVIDAVAAHVPEDRLDALRRAPGVRRV